MGIIAVGIIVVGIMVQTSSIGGDQADLMLIKNVGVKAPHQTQKVRHMPYQEKQHVKKHWVKRGASQRMSYHKLAFNQIYFNLVSYKDEEISCYETLNGRVKFISLPEKRGVCQVEIHNISQEDVGEWRMDVRHWKTDVGWSNETFKTLEGQIEDGPNTKQKCKGLGFGYNSFGLNPD